MFWYGAVRQVELTFRTSKRLVCVQGLLLSSTAPVHRLHTLPDMHSSLFRCGIQGCGSKGPQSFDRFGAKTDGSRHQTCISCRVCFPALPCFLARLANIPAQQKRRPYREAYRRRVQALKASSALSFTAAFDPFLNSLLEPLSTEVLTKERRTAEHAAAPEAVRLAVGLLEHEFDLRKAASAAFPPEITSSHIRTAVSKYEDELSAASERLVCCSCGRFVAMSDIYEINDHADFILPLHRTLDHCGHRENSWDFCVACHSAVSRGKVPKFSALNLLNVTLCQDYPSALEDLTAVEECLIARCHPQAAARVSRFLDYL